MKNNKINTWEDPIYTPFSGYEKLCKESVPSDFFFSVFEWTGTGTCIAIVPKLYFLKEKCMWDQSMPIEHLLPDTFSESMECVWETEKNDLDLVKNELLSMGFLENDEFNNLIMNEYD